MANWAWNWLNRKFGFGVNENQAMLSQFLLNLDVAYARFTKRDAGGETPENERIIVDVLHRFKNGEGTGHGDDHVKWKDAYQAEQLLATLMPLKDVKMELVKYLSEDQILSPNAKKAYDAEFADLFEPPKRQISDAATPPAPEDEATVLPKAQSLLVRILNDVQWRYSRRYFLRKLTQYYLRKLVWTFVAAGAAFTGLLLFFPQTQTEGFYGFFLAVAAGLLGASFSMLTGREQISEIQTLEEMKSATGYGVVLVRIGVGGGAASILYFLFNAGIVTSDLFPKLKEIAFDDVLGAGGFKTPNSDLCKLAFWSFAAGFSEKLVPKLLTRTADGLTEQKPSN